MAYFESRSVYLKHHVTCTRSVLGAELGNDSLESMRMGSIFIHSPGTVGVRIDTAAPRVQLNAAVTLIIS